MNPLAVAVTAQTVDADGNQLLAHDPGPGQQRWSIRLLGFSAERSLSPQHGNEFQIAALDGPLQLSRGNEPDRQLQRLQTATISEQVVLASPEEGCTRVVCLSQQTSRHGQLLLRPLLDHMMLPSRRARWFVHALAGSMRLIHDEDHLRLEMNQSAWLCTAPGQRALIEGAGELALVQLPQ